MNNLEKYLGVLEREGLDALLLTSRVSRLYCAEYDVAEGIAVVSQKGCRYFTDSRYIEAAENHLRGFEVKMVGAQCSYSAAINAAIEDFAIETMGFEEQFMTVAEHGIFAEKLHAKLMPCQKAINCLRHVKEDWELARMRIAQEITDRTFSEVLTRIREGMSEKELCAEVIYCLYKNGAEGLSFDPIVVSGPNTSMPHGVPGERRLQAGDFITMDFGCVYQGYCSDMTRTVALGHASDEMRKVYDTVLRAQKAGIEATKAGATGCEVDGAARAVIEAAGYGEYFGHGYGHSLGLEIHEDPNCNLRNTESLPAGAVCSAEPGIYLPGKFGVRIEDVVIVTEDGCIDITKSEKALIVV